MRCSRNRRDRAAIGRRPGRSAGASADPRRRRDRRQAARVTAPPLPCQRRDPVARSGLAGCAGSIAGASPAVAAVRHVGAGPVRSVPLRPMPSPPVTDDPRIKSLPAAEIRRRFLDFFAERGHTVVPSASLVPAGDQTLLFTNSGMVQFKDVLTGAEKRALQRAPSTTSACLRVAGKHNDFEEVGRTPRHHTFFEMLGNWSFGDYFKREAIHWAWELPDARTSGIPPERLAATTYTDDEVAWNVWRDEIGLPPERMANWGDVDAGDDKNFWRMADTGPCGPCSEIHFDRGAHLSEGPDCIPDHSETLPALARDLEPRVHGVRPAARRPRPAAVHERRHRAWAWSGSRASSSRSRPTTTRTCSRRSTPGCASCWATTPTRSRRSASATRSSPTTRGP